MGEDRSASGGARAEAGSVGPDSVRAPFHAGPTGGGDGTPAPGPPTEAFVRGQDFLRRCIAGEPGMRDEFVALYGALVRYAVAAVLRMKAPELLAADLDDLAQAALLSFFERDCRRLKMYEGRNQASFATFVRVCASRQALDHLRGMRRRPRAAAAEGGDEEHGDRLDRLADPAAGPEDRVETRERIERLRAAVAELPPRERLVVRLAFVEERDAAEIAAVLGVSANAVHVLKSRIRSRLRDRVDLELPLDE